MTDEIGDRLLIFVKEIIKHKWLVIATYTIVNIAILSVGVNWPWTYESSATVIVEDNKVITPLMQGAAIPTDVREYARIAEELIFSRKLMFMALEVYAKNPMDLSTLEREKLIREIEDRANVTTHGTLIEVGFRDTNPEMAQRIAQLLAEAYIDESSQMKVKEGDSAFNFIDKQITEYREKVKSTEAELREWKRGNLSLLSQLDISAGADLGNIVSEIESTDNALREAELIVQSLEMQLASSPAQLSFEDPYFLRLARLQSQLDVLRMSYHDTYPDIIRLKREIEDVKEILRQSNDVSIRSDISVERGARMSSVERELRLRLYNTQSDMIIFNNKLARLESKRQEASARNDTLNAARAELEPMERAVEINTSIYQALLRKKEQARLSLELDLQSQGEGLSIYEDAYLPSTHSGIVFMHFVFLSQIFGIGLPIGAVILRVMYDGRIRSEFDLVGKLDMPNMGVIPHIRTRLGSLESGVSSVAVVCLIAFNVVVVLDRDLTVAVADTVSAWMGGEQMSGLVDLLAGRLQ